MNTVLHKAAEQTLAVALKSIGLGKVPATLSPCPQPELGDAASAAAFHGAKILKRPPIQIAEEIAGKMAGTTGIARADAVHPGYVNLTFDDTAIAAALESQASDPNCGIPQAEKPEKIVIDFGGPNIKPMHVGHLRSLVIGETLRRLLVATGHDVVSDIHLGDWGLPSGMILSEIKRTHPDAPWFLDTHGGPYPAKSPVSATELSTIYPQAAAACKEDQERMNEARATTVALQAGDPGLSALWKLIVADAKSAILETCSRLGAHFDLTLGESDAQPEIPGLLSSLEAAGIAEREGEALVIHVARPDDTHDLPPLVVRKEDGSTLYGTTDLATIVMRARDLGAERIVYVVDARQHLHFTQVFRSAAKANLITEDSLEHVGFGTVNGPDGKPLKTRAGGTMKLVDLLDEAKATALARLIESGRLDTAPQKELEDAADAIGLAALRIADLASNRTSGYTLDLDRAVAFEGKTGPYLLYALVRLRAVLDKAGTCGGAVSLTHPAERQMALACLGLGDAVKRAADTRCPHELVSWAFDMATAISRFYHECPVAGEPDIMIRKSRISQCMAAEQALAKALDLLGCRVPKAM